MKKVIIGLFALVSTVAFSKEKVSNKYLLTTVTHQEAGAKLGGRSTFESKSFVHEIGKQKLN